MSRLAYVYTPYLRTVSNTALTFSGLASSIDVLVKVKPPAFPHVSMSLRDISIHDSGEGPTQVISCPVSGPPKQVLLKRLLWFQLPRVYLFPVIFSFRSRSSQTYCNQSLDALSPL